VRAASPAIAEEALSRAISSADPLLPHDDLRAMTGVIRESIAEPRLMMSLVGALAAAALLLAAIGIHGLITHIVSDRMREFGIRLALGASARQIVTSVAGAGVALAAMGALAGLLLSVYATKLVEASLTELTTKDATTYVGVAALLFAVAGASSFVPALRVTRLDPAKTLRD
jgi:ABC-type antimicrobial peptide transport system permease subunit